MAFRRRPRLCTVVEGLHKKAGWQSGYLWPGRTSGRKEPREPRKDRRGQRDLGRSPPFLQGVQRAAVRGDWAASGDEGKGRPAVSLTLRDGERTQSGVCGSATLEASGVWDWRVLCRCPLRLGSRSRSIEFVSPGASWAQAFRFRLPGFLAPYSLQAGGRENACRLQRR